MCHSVTKNMHMWAQNGALLDICLKQYDISEMGL